MNAQMNISDLIPMPRGTREGNDGFLSFCSTCAFSQAIALDTGHQETGELTSIPVEQLPPLAAGATVFHEGDQFREIYAVRAGTVKTYLSNTDGREQVLGFHLPGEIIGLNAIDTATFPCSAVALETVTLCRLAFSEVSRIAGSQPALQRLLLSMMSRDLATAQQFAGDHSAEERVAAFLVTFSRRLERRGFSGRRFQLTMSRIDIANYLSYAPETISRVISRFESNGMLQVRGREMEIIHMPRLEKLSMPVLRCR